MAEENKPLLAIIEANKDIEEEMEGMNSEDDNSQNDMENDELFADSIININGIKYKRTTPASEAEQTKNQNKEPNGGAKTKRYDCNKCTEVFTTMGLLRRHEKTPHAANSAPEPEIQLPQEQEPTSIKCTKCDFSSDTRANLTNHIRSNHGQRTKKFDCKF